MDKMDFNVENYTYKELTKVLNLPDIFDEDMLPDEWKEYIDINANFFKD